MFSYKTLNKNQFIKSNWLPLYENWSNITVNSNFERKPLNNEDSIINILHQKENKKQKHIQLLHPKKELKLSPLFFKAFYTPAPNYNIQLIK